MARWYRLCACGCGLYYHRDEMVKVAAKLGGKPSHRWKALRCIERERDEKLVPEGLRTHAGV